MFQIGVQALCGGGSVDFVDFDLPYRMVGVGPFLDPSGSSSFKHRRTPELALQKSHASFRNTFRPPGAEDRGRNPLKRYPQSGM